VCGCGAADGPGATRDGGALALAAAARIVRVERDILEKNDRYAATNRARFAAGRTLALNLVSSPGAGKTALLVRTLTELRDRYPLAVIEGDQTWTPTGSGDGRRRCRSAPASCVTSARGWWPTRSGLPPLDGGVLFIENVGNLVCPAGFDLGEAGKVVLASVTEGEDKPLKYPDMFHAARLVLITKTDLLPHLEFDVAALAANARAVNPRAEVLQVSARTGAGLDAWYAWLAGRRADAIG
jgi:hydrogenase nickel incorporation protein HypB